MKVLKMALASGVLLAAPGMARADELAALKAELAALDARMAAMESAPSAPAGYRLLSISETALVETPGAPLAARERAAYAGRSTAISVMPTADAPGGASVSWSGYSRAGVVYEGQSGQSHGKAYVQDGSGAWVRDASKDKNASSSSHDTDVGARGQLLVQAKTGTSVGEVGAELELRADFQGDGTSDVYAKVAWGYWAITPDLTVGGGYNQSIGDIAYGYDGSCTCYFTDNADVDFNPGDTTQLQLNYKTGDVAFNLALESAALGYDSSTGEPSANQGLLGVAGQIVYTGSVFKGEIAGVWRDSSESQTGASQIWQVGVGGSVDLGSAATVTFAAATGEGPYEVQSSGAIIDGLPYNNSWWGASVWSSIGIGDKTHMELAGGYKHRKGDGTASTGGEIAYDVSDVDYHTYALMGGLYYEPVKQLTLGVEAEWYTTSTTATAFDAKGGVRYDVSDDNDTLWADVVAVWSF